MLLYAQPVNLPLKLFSSTSTPLAREVPKPRKEDKSVPVIGKSEPTITYSEYIVLLSATDRQTDRQIDRQTHGRTDRGKHKQIDRHTQTDRPPDRQADTGR
jgi:hypothetical protein